MTLYKKKYRVESNRWQFWDYSAPASYFITICVDKRLNILGHVHHDEMILSENGKIVAGHFELLPTYHPRILLDEWVVMPNHIHCLITLGPYNYNNNALFVKNGGISNDGGIGNGGGTVNNGGTVEKIHEFSLPRRQYPPTYGAKNQLINPNDDKPSPDAIKNYRKLRRKMIIPMVMGKFQMQTSKQINILNDTPGRKNWQFNYHDRVVRNEQEYYRIKNYIRNNPKKWNNDRFNKKKPRG